MAGIPTTHAYRMPTAVELPGNTAPWTVDPTRAVLLVHDMQRYFLEPLPPNPRTELVDNAVRLRQNCAELGIPVVYTAQPGNMTAEQRGLLRDFWGPGMRTSPEDREVVDQLAPGDNDRILTKWRYSAFFDSGLLAELRSAGRDQLILCGVYAHIGVLITAVESYSNDVQTFLAADAVADFSWERHHMALDYAARCCAVVTTVKEALA
ncbi:isochorismate hydrolase [Actinopolyspora lacussalsi]|nr:isochorismate hydrolase [Actinopolyspora lacussalsi]